MAQRFSDEFLAELRMRCDIEQIISSYTPLKRRGKNLVGLCPFHNEKTPSFTVYPESQSFFCFGCGAGGEVISFIRRAENLDYTEAVRLLCDRCGMVMPSEGYDNSLAEKRKRMYEINKEAARFFHSCLFEEQGKAGLDYYKERGLKKGTIIRFGLGYAPDGWRNLLTYMRGKGYSYEELYEANLANKSEKNGKVSFYDSFRNRVMVPIIDVRGNVVAFGGRVLDDSKPKYINSSDTLVYKKSLGVFGLNLAKSTKEKSLILVEGYMDAISLHQAGFDNVIACLGTALTSEMAHLLARYTDEIILSYDADDAGQKATDRAIGIFSSIGMKVRVIHLTGGKDPDEILKKYGPERYRSLIDGAANDIEFELIRLRKDFDLMTSDGKMKYLERAAEVLAKTSVIAQDIYTSRLSEELQVDKSRIAVRIDQLRRRTQRKEEGQKYKRIQQDAMSQNTKIALKNSTNIRAVKAEERLLGALYRNPDFYRGIKGEIAAEDFSVGIHGRIFTLLAERIEEHRSLELTSFSQELAGEEMDIFVQIIKKNENLNHTFKVCSDCVQVMTEEREKRQQNVSAATLSDEDFLALINQQKKGI
ncbi:MAG: DNA primase [Ruminococcaceae bacterium]|nr:DNA primase [Oscillospiraceae bacterium]